MASRTAALQESQCLEKGNSATIESFAGLAGDVLSESLLRGDSGGGVPSRGDSGKGAFGGGGDTSGGVNIC